MGFSKFRAVKRVHSSLKCLASTTAARLPVAMSDGAHTALALAKASSWSCMVPAPDSAKGASDNLRPFRGWSLRPNRNRQTMVTGQGKINQGHYNKP